VAEAKRTLPEPVEPIGGPGEPIELTKRSKGTHLMVDAGLPDGFVPPSAALTTNQAQAASTSDPAADGQASEAIVARSGDQ
jgi:hypothetical protein